ncbi:hypothetical protein BaRGS_00017988 [Batillaria attramentaria]|uniref:Uncharacterized protein n=1 Tax=Batillaria attramentaria TaxID=370345 RepID=A0ABD0KU63_9CAEN
MSFQQCQQVFSLSLSSVCDEGGDMEEVELLFEVIRWCDSRKTSQQDSPYYKQLNVDSAYSFESMQNALADVVATVAIRGAAATRNVTAATRNVTAATCNVTAATRNVTAATRNVTAATRNVTAATRDVTAATRNVPTTSLICVYDVAGMSVFCLCELAAWQMSEDMGENSCLLLCMPCFIIPQLRTKFRTQQNIEGSICNDWLVATFCCPCALCQLIREHNATRP